MGTGADPFAEFVQASSAPQPSETATAASAGDVVMPGASTEAFGQFFTPAKAQGGVGAIGGLHREGEAPPNLNHTDMNQIENDDDEFAAFESAPVGSGAPAEVDAFDFPGFGDRSGKAGAGSQLLEPIDVGRTVGGAPWGEVASPGGGGAASTPGSAAKVSHTHLPRPQMRTPIPRPQILSRPRKTKAEKPKPQISITFLTAHAKAEKLKPQILNTFLTVQAKAEKFEP